MENEKLFRICNDGYNCEQVDEYMKLLKAEYKKLYDFAENTDGKVGILAKQKAELSSENAKLQDAVLTTEAEKAVLQKKLEESERKLNVLAVKLESQRTKLASAVASPAAAPAPASAPSSAARLEDYDIVLKSLATMTMLSEEIVRENRDLRRRLSVYESI